MRSALSLTLMLGCTAFSIGCKTQKEPQSERRPPAISSAPKIYVTNEVSGDLTVIDSGNWNVIATVHLGKRPRGIHPSPDHKTLYISGQGSGMQKGLFKVQMNVPGFPY